MTIRPTRTRFQNLLVASVKKKISSLFCVTSTIFHNTLILSYLPIYIFLPCQSRVELNLSIDMEIRIPLIFNNLLLLSACLSQNYYTRLDCGMYQIQIIDCFLTYKIHYILLQLEPNTFFFNFFLPCFGMRFTLHYSSYILPFLTGRK